MFSNDEFDKMFDMMLNRKLGMNMNQIFERLGDVPYYGYTFTIGADGKPIFKEFGNSQALGVQAPMENKNTVDEIGRAHV